MRCINQIYVAQVGELWENQRLLAAYEPLLEQLAITPDEHTRLRDFVRFQLVGDRSRRVITDWRSLDSFASRAAAFESGAERALDALASQVMPAAEAAGITFDAVITTTATGNLMPGLSYRMAKELNGLVRKDSFMLDLCNVGCTGSTKALKLAQSLETSYRNILIVAFEAPATLADTTSSSPAVWQGNCTFGDGAAAMWVSSDPERGDVPLAIEDLRYTQRSDTGLDLIRWGYDDYYAFNLRDEKSFDQDVRQHVMEALSETQEGWKEQPRWAIHPAGVVLLVRISRKLGIPSEAIQPSVAHYRTHSNMSSVSVLHILRDVTADTPPGASINLLTMGAGFNVIYGRVRRVR